MKKKCVLLLTAVMFLSVSAALAALDGTSKDPARLSTVQSGSDNLRIVGDRVFIVQGGRETPAKDGTYKLQDGTFVTVVNGRIINRTPGGSSPVPQNKSMDNIKKRM